MKLTIIKNKNSIDTYMNNPVCTFEEKNAISSLSRTQTSFCFLGVSRSAQNTPISGPIFQTEAKNLPLSSGMMILSVTQVGSVNLKAD